VVLCGEKPTKSLLERMALNLPVQLGAVAPEEQYEVRRDIEAASLVISNPETRKPRQETVQHYRKHIVFCALNSWPLINHFEFAL
jgi:hypothetical protein